MSINASIQIIYFTHEMAEPISKFLYLIKIETFTDIVIANILLCTYISHILLSSRFLKPSGQQVMKEVVV